MQLIAEVQARLVAEFKREVTDWKEMIDPCKNLDWYALSVGWARAKGLGPTDANHFASYLRYQTNLLP